MALNNPTTVVSNASLTEAVHGKLRGIFTDIERDWLRNS